MKIRLSFRDAFLLMRPAPLAVRRPARRARPKPSLRHARPGRLDAPRLLRPGQGRRRREDADDPRRVRPGRHQHPDHAGQEHLRARLLRERASASPTRPGTGTSSASSWPRRGSGRWTSIPGSASSPKSALLGQVRQHPEWLITSPKRRDGRRGQPGPAGRPGLRDRPHARGRRGSTASTGSTSTTSAIPASPRSPIFSFDRGDPAPLQGGHRASTWRRSRPATRATWPGTPGCAGTPTG
ncbi:MAG: hypothetical protein M0C28_23850 [Candidatus Moduliflexus flocculans]|nr:hypothetical protein [Candidatus Moduliflexus flocculans]